MTDLEKKFFEDMRYIYREAVKIGYTPRIFAGMLVDKGGVETAKILIRQETDGFFRLIELKRPDLTIEAFVIKKKYKELFTEKEIKVCEDRLLRHNYLPPQD